MQDGAVKVMLLISTPVVLTFDRIFIHKWISSLSARVSDWGPRDLHLLSKSRSRVRKYLLCGMMYPTWLSITMVVSSVEVSIFIVRRKF